MMSELLCNDYSGIQRIKPRRFMVSLPCTLGYMQDPSTHPELDSDLWLEAGSTSGPDRN